MKVCLGRVSFLPIGKGFVNRKKAAPAERPERLFERAVVALSAHRRFGKPVAGLDLTVGVVERKAIIADCQCRFANR